MIWMFLKQNYSEDVVEKVVKFIYSMLFHLIFPPRIQAQERSVDFSFFFKKNIELIKVSF